VQELPQRRDEMPSMRNIVPANRRPNIVYEDVPDLPGSALGLKQGRAKSRRERVREVLVLRNCMHLVGRQITETDQVFKTNHGASPRRLCFSEAQLHGPPLERGCAHTSKLSNLFGVRIQT